MSSVVMLLEIVDRCAEDHLRGNRLVVAAYHPQRCFGHTHHWSCIIHSFRWHAGGDRMLQPVWIISRASLHRDLVDVKLTADTQMQNQVCI